MELIVDREAVERRLSDTHCALSTAENRQCEAYDEYQRPMLGKCASFQKTISKGGVINHRLPIENRYRAQPGDLGCASL